ncbi:MAG: flap endonuclease-1 [Candidatus Bathyarchaeia archaeon]
MGIDLGDLTEVKKLDFSGLKGRTICFDGHNILYQFLAIIRGRRGEPLRDHEGRVTSHLSGLIYRNSKLVESGIRVVYVFDGKPHEFKSQVIEERRKTRQSAREKYEKAVEEGDREGARRYGQQAVVATVDIVEDAKTLLSLMGIPWVQAPGEGEAQSAYMAAKGDVWASASQDYDSLLYGAPRLIRNLSITGRRKLPRKNVYIKIEPELIELSRMLEELEISRDQLIDLGILVGTDYNPDGIKGVGPKTALKLIKKHGNFQNAIEHIDNAEFPHPVEEIRELFSKPRTTDNYVLEWREPDTNAIIDFLCRQHSFSRKRVVNAIERLQKGYRENKSRTKLDRWFD